MAEELTLTIPDTIPSYRVVRLNLDWPGARIKIVVETASGRQLICLYEGALASTLMAQLNKANLSAGSLHKRILERLATDGKLPAGAVTGIPD